MGVPLKIKLAYIEICKQIHERWENGKNIKLNQAYLKEAKRFKFSRATAYRIIQWAKADGRI